jgi:hypothetical protein
MLRSAAAHYANEQKEKRAITDTQIDGRSAGCTRWQEEPAPGAATQKPAKSFSGSLV